MNELNLAILSTYLNRAPLHGLGFGLCYTVVVPTRCGVGFLQCPIRPFNHAEWAYFASPRSLGHFPQNDPSWTLVFLMLSLLVLRYP
jgi:hypothetical protein